MIGSLWTRHRMKILAGVAVCLSLGLLCGLLLDRSPRPSPGSPAPSRPRDTPRIAAPTKPAAPRRTLYHPRYVAPPQTSTQTQLAAALATAESPEEIAAGEALRLPAGHYTGEFRPVAAKDETDEFSYAKAWTTELLDLHYRSQSRRALLSWAIAGEAANTLPGVPSNVEDKSLYLSLEGPSLDGVTAPTPVPTTARWENMAERRIVQRVSAIEVSVDPAWNRLVGEGFVPKDPLLAFVDVSGTVTTTEPVHAAPVHRRNFKLVLAVGSALHHPGYGAISVDNWSLH